LTAPSERTSASLGTLRAQRAEELLNSLVGVIDARVVTDDEGGIEEIHILSTSDVSPKQAVRNVESALLAHLDVAVDHRRISVAQAEPGEEPPSASTSPVERAAPPAPAAESHGPIDPLLESESPASRLPSRGPSRAEGTAFGGAPRFLFVGHQVTSQRAQRVETRVTLEWKGQQYEGTAWTPDLPRPRLEAMADATLRAMEMALQQDDEEGAWPNVALSLEGVRVLEAFDRSYALVSVHAVEGRRTTPLSGAVLVGENPEGAVVLATLQATDRRIRGMIEDTHERSWPRRTDAGFGDPFDIWG